MSDCVLSLCAFTGNMVRPWAEAGYTCRCVDLQNDGSTEEFESGGSIEYIQKDVHEYEPNFEPYIAFAFPPCTHLAVSGARWFREKGLKALVEALDLVARCYEILQSFDCPWMLENPVSTLSTYWREPDYTFHPYEYDGYTHEDNAYSKLTCLWTGNGFRMSEEDAVEEYDDRIHKMGPSDNRAGRRSETPEGFARAVFEANEGARRMRSAGEW